MNSSADDLSYLKNLTVLYVEDEDEALLQFNRFLSRKAGRLIIAKNGAEGLEAYRAHKPDIIITDIQMPVMDGLAMSREIRTIDKSVPIIVLTAFCDADYLMQSINIGIDRYVAKPVDGSRLDDALLICAHRLMLEEELRRNRGQRAAAIETVPDMMFVLDEKGNCLQAHTPRTFLPASLIEGLQGKNVYELFPEDAAITVLKALQTASLRGSDFGRTICLQMEQNKHCFDLSLLQKNCAGGEPHRFIMHARDITRRNRTEDEHNRLNREYSAFRACNHALTEINGEEELLNEICRIIVEIGGYRLAWVGCAEHDEAKTVRPVARAGFDEGYLDTLKLTWADTEQGCGPSGIVIRTGQPHLARDLVTEPSFAPWRADALQRGYSSELALPLKIDEQVYGVLHIYSDRSNAFNTEEMRLLASLARSLSFGVSTVQLRISLKQAERALKVCEEQLCRLT